MCASLAARGSFYSVWSGNKELFHFHLVLFNLRFFKSNRSKDWIGLSMYPSIGFSVQNGIKINSHKGNIELFVSAKQRFYWIILKRVKTSSNSTILVKIELIFGQFSNWRNWFSSIPIQDLKTQNFALKWNQIEPMNTLLTTDFGPSMVPYLRYRASTW